MQQGYATCFLVLITGACTTEGAPDGGAPVDAAADGGAGDAAFGPEPPRIDWLGAGTPAIEAPALPALTPCAGGHEVVVETVRVCDPWPESGMGDCAPHEAHFPFEAGCSRVGTTCAADGLPTGLPATGVIFVRRGATGDGSRALPFGRVVDALTAAGSGTTIAVAEGRYAETVTVPAGVALAGACAERTILEGTVTLGGAGASVRNLTITTAARGVSAIADALIEDVIVESGIDVTGGDLDVRNLVVRDVPAGRHGVSVGTGASVVIARAVIAGAGGDALHASGSGAHLAASDAALVGAAGHGAFVGLGARMEIARAAIERNDGTGVTSFGEATLTDAVVRDNGAATTGRQGQGAAAWAGSLALTRVLFASNRFAGIDANAAAVSVMDAVIVDTVADPAEPRSGFGVYHERGSIDAAHVLVARATACGIHLDASTGEISDATVLDTREAPPASNGVMYGCGVEVFSASDLSLSRVRVQGAIRSGLGSWGDGAHVRLADVTISDVVASTNDASGGEGFVGAGAGATIVGERVGIERTRFAGIFLTRGANVMLSDVFVRDVSPPNDHVVSGYGLQVGEGAHATLVRALIERIPVAGIHVLGDGSELTATDLVVRDMQGDPTFGLHGWGIGVTENASASVMRGHIARARYVGAVVASGTSRLTASDFVVEDTLAAACADDLCASAPFGIALGAYSGAQADLTRFVLTRSHVIGVQLASGGTVDLMHGLVSMSPVGANIQTGDFAIDRLTRDVAYWDNEQNLVTDELPVPSIAGVE